MLAGVLAVTAGVAGLAGVAVAENGQMLHGHMMIEMHGMPGHGDKMAADPAAMDAHFEIGRAHV